MSALAFLTTDKAIHMLVNNCCKLKKTQKLDRAYKAIIREIVRDNVGHLLGAHTICRNDAARTILHACHINIEVKN